MMGRILRHYKVGEQLGRGGMGEVYVADDLNLSRKVALKLLPDAFTGDTERMARFEREAKLLASLNHPNIAAVYGLEQAEGKRFIVMEFVEGDTLADRLSKGPLPVDESLAVCRQIAEGLEAAHAQGIVHRDLKPSNVMITHEDRVKILDFGIAKPLSNEMQNTDASQSPTLTDAMTRPGVLLGTSAYMSPEQAKGRAADKRADIWAFGCILYECLTGKRAFEGDTITETLASILKTEPDWSALPPGIPPRIRLLLSRCLEKDKSRRLRDAADVYIEIEGAKAAPNLVDAIRISRSRLWLSVAVVLLFGAAISALAFWLLRPEAPKQVSAHLSVVLPPGDSLAAANLPLALSPDGNQLVYVSKWNDGATQLFRRDINNEEPVPIPGTDGASAPFFSPDGQWIAFFAQGKLRKISAGGGAVFTLGVAGSNAGGTWGDDNTIIFSPSVSSGLSRVSAGGGAPEILTRLDASKGEISHRYPQFLPGSKAVLFTVMTGFGWDDQQIVLHSMETGERRVLLRGGHTGRVLPSGHLIYYRAGALFAVPFDPARGEVGSSAPVKVAEGVRQSDTVAGEYCFSGNGSLAFIPARSEWSERRLVWVDRSGNVDAIPAPPRNYTDPALSPDGRQIAVEIASSTNDIWIYDLERGNLSRLTTEGSSQHPVWASNSKTIVYTGTRGGFRNIFRRAADGTGAEERLTTGQNTQTPFSWSPDSKDLVFTEISPSTGSDLWILALKDSYPDSAVPGKAPKPHSFVQMPYEEEAPAFSPTGHWLAYSSDKSGKTDIYVQPFPGPGRVWQISTDGGTSPRWAPNGRELFYRTGSKMMAVDIQAGQGGATLAFAKPRLLFDNAVLIYGIAPDGSRFLGMQPIVPAQPATQIPVVLNWFAELKQRVPLQ